MSLKQFWSLFFGVMNLLKSATIEHRCFHMIYLSCINPYQLPLSSQIITPMFFFSGKKYSCYVFHAFGFFLVVKRGGLELDCTTVGWALHLLRSSRGAKTKERQTSQKRHRRTLGRWGVRDEWCFSEYLKTRKLSPRVSRAAIPKRPRADQLFRINYASCSACFLRVDL